jgi:hypothetical protein
MNLDYPNVGNKNQFIEYASALKVPQILNRLQLAKYVNFDDESRNEEYKKALLKSKLVICHGWVFRSFETVGKYRTVYKHIFKPNVDELRLFESFLKKEDPKTKILGVHVRRGDYKEFLNGKFFYTDAHYIDKIRQMIRLLGESCRVIIFSNDSHLDHKLYKADFEDVIFSKESTIADHFLMSKCDYLLGPPSTFTMWASYMGEVPLYHIEQADAALDLDSFKIQYG